MVGLALVLRDLVHRDLGAYWALSAILLGSLISALFSPQSLLIASTTAFLLSELSDFAVFAPLRGAEALTYLEAINTGHGGSVSTIHAETAELAIDRLAIMVLQAGTPLTFAEVREYIRKSIDVIVQLGRAEGKRGITEFYLPGRLEAGDQKAAKT